MEVPTFAQTIAQSAEYVAIIADGVNSLNIALADQQPDNLDVIKSADYIIDIGPEGGDEGGTIIASGTPEQIIKVENSYTGQYLKKVLEKG